MTEQEQIEAFLEGNRFAVVGASLDRAKYGNKVFRAYLQNDLDVVPINPAATTVEGVAAVASIEALPEPVDGVSIVTPPHVSELVVEQALAKGIKHLWLQPGAESQQAIDAAEQAGANVIAGGPCILVALQYREDNT